MPDWEDPGYRYIGSNDAAQQLADLGIENSEAVITKVAAAVSAVTSSASERKARTTARAVKVT